MRGRSVLLTALTLVTLPLALAAQAPDTKDVKRDRREVRHDRRELRSDRGDRKSTRLNSSHSQISYAVFCLKKKKKKNKSVTNQHKSVDLSNETDRCGSY